MSHSPAAPTAYLDVDVARPVDRRLVHVMVPAEVADELRLLLVWISLRTDHQVPVDVLLRGLVLGGLVHAEAFVADLQRVVAGISSPAPGSG